VCSAAEHDRRAVRLGSAAQSCVSHEPIYLYQDICFTACRTDTGSAHHSTKAKTLRWNVLQTVGAILTGPATAALAAGEPGLAVSLLGLAPTDTCAHILIAPLMSTLCR